ncbi:hypothetical protein [Streptomyces sp. CBMA156]|uniref:hypothetical protein n=1 Tax=Streptomyces sp. CBMA156 TaxID=1930280 RepID=UPI001661DD30|nr:hypothetical protein [Streptomyces sp. CBMA156]
MRRSAVLAVAAAAVSLVGLVGCTDDAAPSASASATGTTPASATTPEAVPASTPTATATPTPAPTAVATPTPTPTPTAVTTAAGGVIDPEAALALAEKTPYAATQDFVSDGGPISALIKARVNLNGPIRSGRLAESMSVGGDDVIGSANDSPSVVVTDDGTTYIRNGSSWRTSPLGDRIADYHGYAKALLALGPSARKGMEDCEGTPCYHLSGTVDLERMKALEPEQYKILKSKGVAGFRLDQWIDTQGRTVRYDKRTELRGVQMRTHGTFRDFGPAEKVEPPR